MVKVGRWAFFFFRPSDTKRIRSLSLCEREMQLLSHFRRYCCFLAAVDFNRLIMHKVWDIVDTLIYLVLIQGIKKTRHWEFSLHLSSRLIKMYVTTLAMIGQRVFRATHRFSVMMLPLGSIWLVMVVCFGLLPSRGSKYPFRCIFFHRPNVSCIQGSPHLRTTLLLTFYPLNTELIMCPWILKMQKMADTSDQ